MIILPAKREFHFGRGAWLTLSLIIVSIIATMAATVLDGSNTFITRNNLETR